MTWTLSSDWCISRRIASQIKRSSTLEPPLTTSPGPRRRRTMPSTLVCISLRLSLSLSTCISFSFSFAIHVGRFIGKISRVRQSPSQSHSYRSFDSLFTYDPVIRKESLDYLPASFLLVSDDTCSHSNQCKTVHNPVHCICMDVSCISQDK